MSQENKEFPINPAAEPTDDILKKIEVHEIPRLSAESENTNFTGEDPILSTYLRSIPKIRLNLEQDLEFGRRIKLGKETEEHLKSDKLSEEQRRALAVVRAGGIEAKEILISSCLHLVVFLAAKKWVRGTDIMDLIDSGNEGLVKAADRYDPERGFRFITYATYWAKKEISKEIAQSLNVISIPQHILERQKQINLAKSVIQNRQKGEKPTHNQVKEATGLTEYEFQNSQKAKITVVSANKSINLDDDSAILMDQIKDPEQNTPDLADDRIFRENFNLMVGELPPRYERTLRELTGISEDGKHDTTPLTQADVARKFGISKERVRQLRLQIKRQIVKSNIDTLSNRKGHSDV